MALPISLITVRMSREIEVDQARHDHQVGNAANPGIQHIVGHFEGVGEGCLFIRDPKQVLVRNNDQRIDEILKILDPFFCKAAALRPLEIERLGDDPRL